MKKCLNNRTKWIAIVVIAALALGVRLIGLNHGSPKWVFHPDVAKQAKIAKYNYRGVTNPRVVYHRGDEETLQHAMYPYGASVLAGRGARTVATLLYREPNRFWNRPTFFWAYVLRQVGVYAFVLSLIAVLAGISRKMGLLPLCVTGLLLALEPFHVQYAHYGMNDIPLLCCMLLAWILSGALWEEPCPTKSNRYWRPLAASAAIGLALGIGVGIKYQAIVGFMFPGLAWLGFLFRRRWRDLFICVGVTLVAFVLATMLSWPLLWKEPAFTCENFLPFMQWQSKIFSFRNVTGETYDVAWGHQALRNLNWTLRHAYQSGLFLLLPAVVWACITCLRLPRSTATDTEKAPSRALLGSALLFLLLMNAVLIAGRQLMRENDIMLTTPFLFLIAGFCLHAIWQHKHVRSVLGGAALAVCLLLTCLFAVRVALDDRAFLRPDTRVRARAWCQQNLAARKLCRDRYTISPQITGMQDAHVNFLSDTSCAPGIVSAQYDYLMASSLAWHRFADRHSLYYSPEKVQFHADLKNQYELISIIEDREMLHTHPTINIYKRRTP
jgi:hypothetical protein